VERFIVGIDVGTTKVCTLIGKLGKSGFFEIAGKGFAFCSGVRKGIIVDIENVANAIAKSVEEAESSAGVKIISAYTNISASHANVVSNRTSIDISGENREITRHDTEKLLHSVREIQVAEDRFIVDVLPRQYVIDGFDEIVDPIGMIGTTLEIDADIIIGKKASVQNLFKAFQRAGLKIDGIVVEAFSLGEIALNSDEKEVGVVLIDIGGGVTNISVFRNKKMLYYDSIPIGGEHITNDISIGLKIPYTEAEKIKREYELALTSLIKNDQDVILHDLGDTGSRNVRVSEIVEIIEARVCEIFSLCREHVLKNKVDISEGAGIVLTGGGISYVDGNWQLASDIFGLPARVAAFKPLGITKPEYAISAGMIKYISGMNKTSTVNPLKRLQPYLKPEKHNNLTNGFIKILKKIF